MARIRTHTNPFNYYERMTPIDFKGLYPGFESMDLEIGFGRGVFLRNWAKKNPHTLVLGAEIRKQIVDVLKQRCDAEDVKNVHLCHGQGLIFVEDCLPDQRLDNVFIFHPDPWFKKRHYNRRVVSVKLLDALAKKMKPDGLLHVSTDVGVLWEDIMEKISEHNQFKPVENDDFWQTHYESHWSVFSEKDKRDQFFGSFKMG